MFGFWKKKGGEIPEEQQWQRSAEQRAKERQEAAEIPQALRTLGQDFLPEELEVLAVTGANPFSGSQGEEGEGLWPAFIGLTAWRRTVRSSTRGRSGWRPLRTTS